ncbi:hypothetical protein A2U01_0059431, partial [Trifolium medium]|nr:hypothetical protein [Trifolium medium]
EQYGAFEAQRKAQEEARAAAARSPAFTYSELGLDDPDEFNNFMNHDPPANV